MTREEARAWLDKLVDDHLIFNGDVEWREGAVDALLALVDQK